MKNAIFLLLLLVLLSEFAGGQTYRQYLKAADEEFANKNYYSAMKHYEEAMSIEGELPEVLFKYAEAARLFASYTFADTAYTKILSGEQAAAYPLARYWLAAVKKKQGKYEEAQTHFRKFIDEQTKGANQEYVAVAKEEIEALDWAIEAIMKPDEDVKVERLDDRVNSPYSEFAPVQAGKVFYFTTQNFQKVIKKGLPPRMLAKVMKRKDGDHSPEPVSWNDEDRHAAHTAFTKDGKRVYYTLCEYVGESAEIRCELLYRNTDGQGKFGDPVRLPSHVNQSGFTTTDPRLGYDQSSGKDWLFFVSDRPGGAGGLDIWATVLASDGSFSTPFNLKEINTPKDDITPVFHTLSQTLYFSSNGRQGFGGYDIYKSELTNGNWGEVEHLPAPFNNSYDDTHFWLNDERTKGFFASNRLGSHVLEPEFEACCNDIYAFAVQVIDLDLTTFNKKNNQPLEGVTVDIFELKKDGDFKLFTTTNQEDNDFKFELKKNTKYVALATRDQFLPIRDTIDLTLPQNTRERTLERKLYLVPVTVDLLVKSFDKASNSPLKEVEVRLVVDGRELEVKKNDDGNTVSFVLDRGKEYQIIGTRVAYLPDTATVDLRFDVTSTDVARQLFLQKKKIENFPPLIVYFDNDQPDPRTRKPTTSLSYKDTYHPYMARKEVFATEYSKALEGRDSFLAAKRIEAFFDREVKNNFLNLEVFTEDVYKAVHEEGFKVELVIQGFTSPRASADYNYTLSQRRSDCLKNHFEQWQGGVLMPYIQQGMLTMQVIGFGEKLAPQFLSDKLDDERESIYSMAASFERKVAIIGARVVREPNR
jgi:hypothetical protein